MTEIIFFAVPFIEQEQISDERGQQGKKSTIPRQRKKTKGGEIGRLGGTTAQKRKENAMKQKHLAAVLLATLAVTAITAFSSFASTLATTGVVGSVHDISAFAANSGGAVLADNEGRVCIFCHTPHHASEDASLGTTNPLWNHQVTTQVYQPYKTSTFDSAGSMIGGDPLLGSSRLCMSCHDGSIAIDTHGGSIPQAGGAMLSGNKVVGSTTSTTSDHPIGIHYLGLQQAEPTKLRDPTLNWIAGTAPVQNSLEMGGYMTCATCHEVHNKRNVIQNVAGDGATYNRLLRSKQQGSAICRSCHSK